MKKIFALILCLILAIFLAACGKSNDADFAVQDFAYDAKTETSSVELFSDSAASTAKGSEVNEKIIKTVDLSVQTKEYDAYISSLNSSIVSAGGYVENSTTDFGGYSNSNRYATYVVRIPADKLGDFILTAGEKGKIISKTEKQENVTLEYVDLESRIEAYKTERETLTDLLEKAASLENVLSIQERLSEVNYQIETYTSQLKVLENRVSYSTVTLNIREVERVTEEKPTLWTQIKNEFSDNLDDLIDGLREIVVGVIGGLPIILPFVAVIAVAVLIIKRIIKKRRNKRNIG